MSPTEAKPGSLPSRSGGRPAAWRDWMGAFSSTRITPIPDTPTWPPSPAACRRAFPRCAREGIRLRRLVGTVWRGVCFRALGRHRLHTKSHSGRFREKHSEAARKSMSSESNSGRTCSSKPASQLIQRTALRSHRLHTIQPQRWWCHGQTIRPGRVLCSCQQVGQGELG